MSYFPGLFAILFIQTRPSSSPIPGILLIASIVGAVADYKYKKDGGNRPSKRDRILFLAVILVVAGFIVWAASINSEIAGIAAVPLSIFLFFAWELGRWRMRRKHPLQKAENAVKEPPTAAS